MLLQNVLFGKNEVKVVIGFLLTVLERLISRILSGAPLSDRKALTEILGLSAY